MPRGKKKSSKESPVPDAAPAPTSYDSMGAAAAGMRLDIEVIKEAKRNGAPGFRGSRVYPEELAAWLKENGVASNPRAQAELRIFLADAVFKEQRNEIQAGKFTKNEVFIAAIEELANEQRTILRQKLENEYPSVVAGLEPAQARVYGKRVVDDLFRLMAQLADRFRRKLAGPPGPPKGGTPYDRTQGATSHPDRPQPHGGRLKTGGTK